MMVPSLMPTQSAMAARPLILEILLFRTCIHNLKRRLAGSFSAMLR